MRNLALVCVVVAARTASAQPVAQPAAPGPADVLANVQKYYANAKHLTAQFRQVVTNAAFNTTKTSDGSLWVAKPAQLRWDYLRAEHSRIIISKTFISDGQTFWLIDHDTKQIVQAQTQTSAVPAAVSFLTGGANLASQFDVALNTSGTIGGANATVLELTPKQPSAQYTKLYFVVDPSDWRVQESIVIDGNGDTNTFKFVGSSLTSTVKPAWFRVNPSSMPTYTLVVAGGQQQPPPSATTGSGSAAAPTP